MAKWDLDSRKGDGTCRLTKRQAAIIGAYTGYACGPWSDIREYVDEAMGRKLETFEFVTLADLIHEATKPDFLELVYVENTEDDCE